jgi:hypothetical protein
MNSVGWLGGGVAPVAMASASGVGNGHVPERDVGGPRGSGFAVAFGAVLDDAKPVVVLLREDGRFDDGCGQKLPPAAN